MTAETITAPSPALVATTIANFTQDVRGFPDVALPLKTITAPMVFRPTIKSVPDIDRYSLGIRDLPSHREPQPEPITPAQPMVVETIRNYAFQEDIRFNLVPAALDTRVVPAENLWDSATEAAKSQASQMLIGKNTTEIEAIRAGQVEAIAVIGRQMFQRAQDLKIAAHYSVQGDKADQGGKIFAYYNQVFDQHFGTNWCIVSPKENQYVFIYKNSDTEITAVSGSAFLEKDQDFLETQIRNYRTRAAFVRLIDRITYNALLHEIDADAALPELAGFATLSADELGDIEPAMDNWTRLQQALGYGIRTQAVILGLTRRNLNTSPAQFRAIFVDDYLNYMSSYEGFSSAEKQKFANLNQGLKLLKKQQELLDRQHAPHRKPALAVVSDEDWLILDGFTRYARANAEKIPDATPIPVSLVSTLSGIETLDPHMDLLDQIPDEIGVQVLDFQAFMGDIAFKQFLTSAAQELRFGIQFSPAFPTETPTAEKIKEAVRKKLGPAVAGQKEVYKWGAHSGTNGFILSREKYQDLEYVLEILVLQEAIGQADVASKNPHSLGFQREDETKRIPLLQASFKELKTEYMQAQASQIGTGFKTIAAQIQFQGFLKAYAIPFTELQTKIDPDTAHEPSASLQLAVVLFYAQQKGLVDISSPVIQTLTYAAYPELPQDFFQILEDATSPQSSASV